MPRYKLTIEYDGMPYCGWQRQKGAYSVQEALETAIKRLSQEDVRLTAAGRTDAGVHAYGQVVHVDLCADWLKGQSFNENFSDKKNRLCAGLNAHLQCMGEKISVLSAREVSKDFDARFCATKRHYLFRILNRFTPPVLESERVWWVKQPLCVSAMQAGARYLIGKHDFTTFRASQCQALSPVRSLDLLEIEQRGEYIEIRAQAPSFLHHQIRSIVGSLVEVGRGRYAPIHMKHILEACDRKACGQVAPPYGLYFLRVDYDNEV